MPSIPSIPEFFDSIIPCLSDENKKTSLAGRQKMSPGCLVRPKGAQSARYVGILPGDERIYQLNIPQILFPSKPLFHLAYAL